MKNFKMIILLLGIFTSLTFGYNGGSSAPETDNISNSSIKNTASCSQILPLKGQDTSGVAIEKFKIMTLPSSQSGVLYMADGTTTVNVNQALNSQQSSSLCFTPHANFVGTTTFTYSSIDGNGDVDLSPATVSIPVVGGTCTEAPTSDNKRNGNIVNNSNALDIVNLSGTNCSGTIVNKFKIKTLPNAAHGILYMADGVTAVTVGQILTLEAANGLKFDPVTGFVGDASFTYVAVAEDGSEDLTPATVTLPIVATVPGGGACTEAPTTNNVTNNTNIANDSNSVGIVNLEGKDCAGNNVESFEIKTLPTTASGTLYMADGVTAVRVGDVLTREQANGLRFDPADGFVGDATFTYVAIDANGVKDLTPATVTLPIVATVPGGGGCTDAPTTDDKVNGRLRNNLPASNILNLSGEDCAGNDIVSFEIKTLPNPASGILYMADGVTAVTVGLILTQEEANDLRFDPAAGFVGDAIFTYVAIDGDGRNDPTAATVTIPVVDSVGGGGACTEAPISDDKRNTNIANNLNAVDIINLAGTDCAGNNVESFEIKTLPDAASGTLYMADGVTAVRVGDVLTRDQADGLRFNPTAGFVGDASFTYVAIDRNGFVDGTPATVILPIVAAVPGGGGACTEAPSTDDKNNARLLNTLPAVNILNLSGKDCAGNSVQSFEIRTLPDAAHGTLYMADGVTAVTVGQILTIEEADGLRFDPAAGFVGDATFTYVAIDGNGVKDLTPATVTIPLSNVINDADIVTNPDIGIANGNANPITINVLANDTGNLDGARVHLLNEDGTLTDRLVVEGEGIWNVNADNTITFTPVAPFVGTPSPVRYLVEDANGGRSNISSISISGECVCEDYESSIPTNSPYGLILMFLLTLIVATKSFKAKI